MIIVKINIQVQSQKKSRVCRPKVWAVLCGPSPMQWFPLFVISWHLFLVPHHKHGMFSTPAFVPLGKQHSESAAETNLIFMILDEFIGRQEMIKIQYQLCPNTNSFQWSMRQELTATMSFLQFCGQFSSECYFMLIQIQDWKFFQAQNFRQKVVAGFERGGLVVMGEILVWKVAKTVEIIGFGVNLQQYHINIPRIRMIDLQILSGLTIPSLHQKLYSQSWQWMREKYILSSKTRSLKEIHQMAQKLNQKQPAGSPWQGEDHPGQKMEGWGFGELKIFQTVCIVYSLLFSTQLQHFAQPQYSYLKKIFTLRSENFLRYEVSSLLRVKVKSNPEWKKREEQIFTKIVEEDEHFSQKDAHKIDKYQWRYYSFQLFTRSKGKYFRPLQQCREKWMNHLNPELNHAPWTVQEDIKLFELIGEMGNKWSAISKAFGMQRTEHMVKNRFNSLIKVWKNKGAKSIPPRQISKKVLDLLHEKAQKGKQILKKQISQLFNPSKTNIELQQEISAENDSELQLVSSSKPELKEKFEEVVIGGESCQFDIEENLSDHEMIEEFVESKIQMLAWSRDLKLNVSKCFEDEKGEKKTWDDQFGHLELRIAGKDETRCAKKIGVELIEVQGLESFNFVLQKSDSYLDCFSRGYGNREDQGIFGIEQMQIRYEQAWLPQFGDKYDINEWLQ